MANIDRKRSRVDQKVLDELSGRETKSQCAQLFNQLGPTCSSCRFFKFNADDRSLINADKCRTKDCRVSIENSFAWNCKKRLISEDDSLRFAAAKPQAALFIEITDITHAMPDSVSIGDLVQRI